MGIVPQRRMSRRSRVWKILWFNGELFIIGIAFIIALFTNTFWIMVLPPFGYVTWAIIAQIVYMWASPKWMAKHPRVTKGMLRGEIADLRYKLNRKNFVVKGYSETVMNLLEEVKRLKKEGS